jgi:hypothetical protein
VKKRGIAIMFMNRRRRSDIRQFNKRALCSECQYDPRGQRATHSEFMTSAVCAINIANKVQLSSKQRANDVRASDSGEAFGQMPPLSNFAGATDGAGMSSISIGGDIVVGVGGSTAMLGMFGCERTRFVACSAEIWMSC